MCTWSDGYFYFNMSGMQDAKIFDQIIFGYVWEDVPWR